MEPDHYIMKDGQQVIICPDEACKGPTASDVTSRQYCAKCGRKLVKRYHECQECQVTGKCEDWDDREYDCQDCVNGRVWFWE